MQAYSDVTREDSPTALPEVEVFYADDKFLAPSGFYYWFCFPGCLPDSDPIGPFETEAEALEDARDY